MASPARHPSQVSLNSEQVSTKIYSQMTYLQKWQEYLKLREVAWTMKAAGLRLQYPDWPEDKIQEETKRIFLYATT